ncbi:simple sugar transport system permease protein [Thermocatellispora tengchongensis]|uniref:Simple sugar transport system permease protein n=1 Tax=Thermocatellispora tengchongensis TaxID=1073253 RepID=A0A840PSV6_9ACTN|nr:ABC transporter permease [Thermocatellispora tengchongensis]MBB5139025.1 simple sugar transport system permease protein [Thermocatellispora tengchongensis]
MNVDHRSARTMAVALLAGAAIAGAIIAGVAGGASLPSAAAAFADGAFGSGTAWGATVATAVPILLTGISASIAFRAGIFNLGQPGMFVAGAVAAGALAPVLPGPPLPNVLLTLAVSVAAGALWAAAVAGASRLAAVDVLVISLIMNYLADGLATLLTTRVFRDPAALGVVETRLVPARLPLLIEQSSFHAGALLAAAVCVGYWWVLNQTRAGHRLRLYGHNPRFAAASGTPPRRYEMRVTLVAGAVSGLAGGIQVLGVFLRYIDGSIGGSGSAAWTGLILAILAPLGSLVLIPGALFLACLQTGLLGVERMVGVSSRLSLVIQAVVMIAVAYGRGRALRAQRARAGAEPAQTAQPQAAEGVTP